jgi:imidazolonepropionase-like amidohydrolase
MAEEEWEIVRRVPNKAQDDMVLPRAGTLASWIRNTITEMNKAHGAAIAAFIEAGGTYPCNEPGCDGDIVVVAQDPFVKIAYRKLKQWVPGSGCYARGTSLMRRRRRARAPDL